MKFLCMRVQERGFHATPLFAATTAVRNLLQLDGSGPGLLFLRLYAKFFEDHQLRFTFPAPWHINLFLFGVVGKSMSLDSSIHLVVTGKAAACSLNDGYGPIG